MVAGIDVDETFSLVVKPSTIQTILSLATSQHWPVHQLDVKNTFLHDSSRIIVSERKYVVEILERARMLYCNPSRTLVDTEPKLGDDGDLGTLDHGLQLVSSINTSLVAYSDADWAGRPTTRRSTSSYWLFLGNNLLSWSSKRQPTLSRSIAEAEYHDVANVVRVLHVPSRYKYADILTKGLPSTLFEEFRTSLSARCPPAPTAEEC
ncbi:ribonuclease H-like domain-containing protein [Tanacetum coccineum]